MIYGQKELKEFLPSLWSSLRREVRESSPKANGLAFLKEYTHTYFLLCLYGNLLFKDLLKLHNIEEACGENGWCRGAEFCLLWLGSGLNLV